MASQNYTAPQHDTSPWTQAFEMFCEQETPASATKATTRAEEQAPTLDALVDVYNPMVWDDTAKRV